MKKKKSKYEMSYHELAKTTHNKLICYICKCKLDDMNRITIGHTTNGYQLVTVELCRECGQKNMEVVHGKEYKWN